MFGERTALLFAGKVKPQTVSEEVLVNSYNAAMDGQSLLKAYFQIPEVEEISKEDFLSFILGYSYGSRVRQFTEEELKSIPDDKLN